MWLGQGPEVAGVPDDPPQKNHLFCGCLREYQGDRSEENVGVSDATAFRRHSLIP